MTRLVQPRRIKLSTPTPTLLSRLERSEVEGPTVLPFLQDSANNHLPLCHLDRSEAQWRDLQFRSGGYWCQV